MTSDELCQPTVTFAAGIKAVWPAAPVLGFVSYGWNGFTTLQDAPDAKSKGDFIEYFLTQMQIAERNAGRRLVDYLDLHWYPEARGGGARIVFDAPPTGAANVTAYEEARLQAPRSLWDPTYQEISWITANLPALINLLPRMREKIAANYPGTKLSITEWNYGGGSDITGAIATADVLGSLSLAVQSDSGCRLGTRVARAAPRWIGRRAGGRRCPGRRREELLRPSARLRPSPISRLDALQIGTAPSANASQLRRLNRGNQRKGAGMCSDFGQFCPSLILRSSLSSSSDRHWG